MKSKTELYSLTIESVDNVLMEMTLTKKEYQKQLKELIAKSDVNDSLLDECEIIHHSTFKYDHNLSIRVMDVFTNCTCRVILEKHMAKKGYCFK